MQQLVVVQFQFDKITDILSPISLTFTDIISPVHKVKAITLSFTDILSPVPKVKAITLTFTDILSLVHIFMSYKC